MAIFTTRNRLIFYVLSFLLIPSIIYAAAIKGLEEGSQISYCKQIDFVGGSQTLTSSGLNCTLTSTAGVAGGDVTDVGDCSGGACFTDGGPGAANVLVVEGTTDDTVESQLVFPADPTVDAVLTIPDDQITTGDIVVGSGAGTFSYTAKSSTNLSDFNDDLTHTATDITADIVDYTDLKYNNTLAGNPALGVDECFNISTITGGGFICEGSTADTSEQLYKFPDVNSADSTEYIVVADNANVSGAEAGYLDGVTSAIQTQIDNKLFNNANDTMTGTLTSDGLTVGTEEDIKAGSNLFMFDLNGETWLTSNASWDGTNMNMVNTANNAIFMQMMGGGQKFPAGGDPINGARNGEGNNSDGVAFWKSAAGNTNPLAANFTDANGLEFMFGSLFGNFVIAGMGFELDGSGTSPFGRIVHNNKLSSELTALARNVFADFSGVDDETEPSWFAGFDDASGANNDFFKIMRADEDVLGSGQNTDANWDKFMIINDTGNYTLFPGIAATDHTITLDGETNDMILTYMEDEDRLDFDGAIRSGTNGSDGQISIYSEEGVTDQVVTFNPHANMTQDTTYTLPADDGTANQFLQTDGSGALTWATPSGSGDITDVFSCASGDCSSITIAATDLLDMSGSDASTITEGLILPQHATACAGGTAEGQVCWEADADKLWIGDGSTLTEIGGTKRLDVNLPVFSAKLTGNAVTMTPAGCSTTASTQGAGIDAGDGNWRLLFDATTDEAAVWQFRMPNNYSSSPLLKVGFSMASATVNKVEFEAAIKCITPGTDNENIGTNTSTEWANCAVGTSTTVAASAGRPYEQSITLTDDSCAAGDIVMIWLSTDADDITNDNATGNREVVYATFTYTGS